MQIKFEIDMDSIEGKNEDERKKFLKKKMTEIHNIEKIVFEALKETDERSHDKIMAKHKRWLESYPTDNF